MATGISITIKNAKVLNTLISQLGKKMETEANKLIETEFNVAVQEAKSIAQTSNFTGRLSSGIRLRKSKNGLVYESTAPYSAYAEFGIRGQVKVPAGFEPYAMKYKGAGKGGRRSAWDKILAWMIFKNIPDEFWYPVYMKLMGMGKWKGTNQSGHPPINNGLGFFIGPYVSAKGRIIRQLKGLLGKAIK